MVKGNGLETRASQLRVPKNGTGAQYVKRNIRAKGYTMEYLPICIGSITCSCLVTMLCALYIAAQLKNRR